MTDSLLVLSSATAAMLQRPVNLRVRGTRWIGVDGVPERKDRPNPLRPLPRRDQLEVSPEFSGGRRNGGSAFNVATPQAIAADLRRDSKTGTDTVGRSCGKTYGEVFKVMGKYCAPIFLICLGMREGLWSKVWLAQRSCWPY